MNCPLVETDLPCFRCGHYVGVHLSSTDRLTISHIAITCLAPDCGCDLTPTELGCTCGDAA